jgi:hypothetical protein
MIKFLGMKLMFVDEIIGSMDDKLFGICLVVIDSSHYFQINNIFKKKLSDNQWPHEKEIKGRFLFSRDPVCGVKKSPTEMVNLVEDIIEPLLTDKTSKCNIVFSYNYDGKSSENYRHLLCVAISKIPKCSKKNSGKNLTSVFCDFIDEFSKPKSQSSISSDIAASLLDRGYILIDGCVAFLSSSNNSVGVCYADIFAYVSKWIAENPIISSDNNFSINDIIGFSDKTEVMQKKIKKVYELKDRVKKIKIINSKNPSL